MTQIIGILWCCFLASESLGITSPDYYYYLNQSGTFHVDGTDDDQEFQDTLVSLSCVSCIDEALRARGRGGSVWIEIGWLKSFCSAQHYRNCTPHCVHVQLPQTWVLWVKLSCQPSRPVSRVILWVKSSCESSRPVSRVVLWVKSSCESSHLLSQVVLWVKSSCHPCAEANVVNGNQRMKPVLWRFVIYLCRNLCPRAGKPICRQFIFISSFFSQFSAPFCLQDTSCSWALTECSAAKSNRLYQEWNTDDIGMFTLQRAMEMIGIKQLTIGNGILMTVCYVLCREPCKWLELIRTHSWQCCHWWQASSTWATSASRKMATMPWWPVKIVSHEQAVLRLPLYFSLSLCLSLPMSLVSLCLCLHLFVTFLSLTHTNMYSHTHTDTHTHTHTHKERERESHTHTQSNTHIHTQTHSLT